MKDIKKLTILDFKKEQLVNLNDEEMFKIKGGVSSFLCFFENFRHGYFKKRKSPKFKVTDNNLGADILMTKRFGR